MDLNFQPPYDFKEGALLMFDKPYEWSSFQLVKKVRYLVNAKVGHAGTLDPLATGLMLLCTGKYTKKIQELQNLDKTYTGTIKIGATTASFDRETEEENATSFEGINAQEIFATAQEFLGENEQVPPMYSAIKREGKKLYEYARKGEVVLRAARTIEISEFEITDIRLPFLDFKISCSKGTYIRSIANDFGEKLGTGGYLYNLRRTRIGDFHIQDSWELQQFINMLENKR